MRAQARAALLVALAACGEGFPRDPEGTTSRVASTGVMRVGVTEHPPWVVKDGARARGLEADLIARFAAARGVRVDWEWGQQEALLEKLARYQLDLVAGGIREKTAWSEKIGLTTTRTHARADAPVLAVPPGENRWLGEVERFLKDDPVARFGQTP